MPLRHSGSSHKVLKLGVSALKSCLLWQAPPNQDCRLLVSVALAAQGQHRLATTNANGHFGWALSGISTATRITWAATLAPARGLNINTMDRLLAQQQSKPADYHAANHGSNRIPFRGQSCIRAAQRCSAPGRDAHARGL